jgi:hypothetical protein
VYVIHIGIWEVGEVDSCKSEGLGMPNWMWKCKASSTSTFLQTAWDWALAGGGGGGGDSNLINAVNTILVVKRYIIIFSYISIIYIGCPANIGRWYISIG